MDSTVHSSDQSTSIHQEVYKFQEKSTIVQQKKKKNRMNILESSHKRFILLGICPSNSDNPFIKFRNIALSVALFAINVVSAIGSVIFVFRNSSTNLEGSLHGAMTVTASTAVLYMTIVAIILRHEIDDNFSAFQTIYDKCMCLVQIKRKKKYWLSV